ncbi:4Fe-4S dicluster domain-containing protein [Desulfobaculum sp.]
MARVETLKKLILDRLGDVDFVLGWQAGYDPLHASPLRMHTPEDVDKMVFDQRCVHNLATYLPSLKDKTVGVVIKGCDSRSVIQLLQEKLISRDNLVIFGMPCEGVVSHNKLRRHMDVNRVTGVTFHGETITITTDEGERDFPFADIAADKCLSCKYPNPLVFDHIAGEPIQPREEIENRFARLEKFEDQPLEDRFRFWQEELSRCTRCYACRNACPLCVCRDHCIAETRDPHWLSQETGVQEKWMFQLIHAMHTAGRCTECGECERACPMDIPVLMLKKKLNREVLDLFDYEAGLDECATPPLFTFKVEEDHIEEKEW